MVLDMYLIKNVELMRSKLSFKFPCMIFDSITEMFFVVCCRELKHGGGSEQAEGAKC